MRTEVQAPIKIAVLGMDERSVARMETIFKIIYKGRCKITQGDDAQLGIVDLDHETDAWEKFQSEYAGLPSIVMSESPTAIEGAIHVAKPAKLDFLWDSIFSLVTGLPPVGASSVTADSAGIPSPDVNEVAETALEKPASGTTQTSSTAAALGAKFNAASASSKVIRSRTAHDEAALFYNPENYLLGHILSALKDKVDTQCVINVRCWIDRRLILLPDEGRVYTNLTDSQLKNLGVATLNEGFAVEIDSVRGAGKGELSASETDDLRSMSIDYLIWDLALRTARGRVPSGTDLSMLFHLQHWPNFPRLPHTPHGMRIASLWVGNPCTLDDIAVNLGIEPADVYSFYSAAAAIGLAGSATRQADGLIAPMNVAKEKPTRRGLLASILRHISN
ncbi:MAG: hypothetical protein PVF75_05175 [Granulosicoccaceae bacterium]|jgi:hypothetical protein